MKRLHFHGAENMGGNAAHVVPMLQQLLGTNTVFVGIPTGLKRPVLSSWTKLTIADMTPDYLRSLETGNVGVVLGEASEGLCSIDFDKDEYASEFIALNPALKATLITKGARGCNVWVRIIGDYPKLSFIKDSEGVAIGEWRSTNGQTVIHGVHPTGRNYEIVNRSPVVTLPFAEINWNSSWKLPWIAEPEVPAASVPQLQENPMVVLIEKYGEPFYRNDSGKVVKVNEEFWSGCVIAENNILFEPQENRFYLYQPETGLWNRISEAVLGSMVSQRLLKASREARESGLEQLRGHWLDKAIVEKLKGLCQKAKVFDERKTVIHVQNGVLTTPENMGEEIALCSFSPDFYSRNQTPLVYDKKAECPRFLNELLHASMSSEDAELLQMFAGQSLLGENQSQTILILHGEGGTGKSTIADVINRLIGRQNVAQLRTNLLGERFELARFYGKTLLAGADVEPTFLKQRGANMLKSLVGGDILHGEIKGSRESLTIKGNFNVLITCNQRLVVTINGDVSAWLRRLLIIEFTGKPPEKKIPNFSRLLIETE